MTTFSQLVDEIVREVGRPDLRGEVGTYLNQTIREMHFEPERGKAFDYRDNLRELQLTADVDTGFGWDIPDSGTFQRVLAVRYDSIYAVDSKTQYAEELEPGPGLAGRTRFWYRAGQRINFAGYGSIGSKISIAWFEYPRRLKYFQPNGRPAQYDSDLGWTYAPEFDTPELRPAAQAFVTNWLLMRWVDVVSEGVRAKIYKRVADEQRARTSYSMYKTLCNGVYTAETATSG